MRDSAAATFRLGAALFVLGAGYVGAAWYLGQHVPANTTVAGVPVGGMTPQQARATVERAVGAEQSAPVVLAVQGQTVTVDPASAGLSLDVSGTLDGLSGFSLRPSVLWDHLTGGADRPLHTSVDRAKLEAALSRATQPWDTTAVDGGVAFAGGTVHAVQPSPGTKVAIASTAAMVAARWPAVGPIEARLDVSQPAVSAQEVTRAVTQFATPAMSAPVKVVVGAKSFALAPTVYASALSMRADASGHLQPVVDQNALVQLVQAAATTSQAVVPARDASYALKGNAPTVVPAVAGTTVNPASVMSAFLPALTSRTRTAAVATTVVQPHLTTVQAQAVAPKQAVGTFSTQLPADPARVANLVVAAKALDGTFVAPGQLFSLNAVLGQPTGAKGYRPASVVQDGGTGLDVGGGVSQLSTTALNAAFVAGVRIEQFRPHPFVVPGFPIGRDAALSWPDVDLQWTNDSGSGILIQALVAGKTLTVTLYGTKVWDIQATQSPPSHVVKATTVVDASTTCVPQPASDGFDVTVTRMFMHGPTLVRTSTFFTHYRPQDGVTCTHHAP